MLIEFRVRNFRSIRDETNLSLVASADKSLADTNLIASEQKGVPSLVRTAVIYGANASGKTTLLRAIENMRQIVIHSGSWTPSTPIPRNPFRLDDHSSNEPTLFEATVVVDGVRYQYGFEFSAERIEAEWLLVYQTAKPQVWFDRRRGVEGEEVFEFGSHLKGNKNVWRQATRANCLFLSMAVQLNGQQLNPLFEWFKQELVVSFDGGLFPGLDMSERLLKPFWQEHFTGVLSGADIGIEHVHAIAKPYKGPPLKSGATGGTMSRDGNETEEFVPLFRHRVGDVTVDFELEDESQGTQKLFHMAGMLRIVLAYGSTMVIDELDSSLHPNLLRKLIETFQSPSANSKGAQLIFTTHDTSLLDASLFRRDQIWFAEKRADQSAELVPLTQFSPRKGEALEKNYLAGRYGGVPILARDLVDGEYRGEG